MLMKLETYNHCWKTTHHAKLYFDRLTDLNVIAHEFCDYNLAIILILAVFLRVLAYTTKAKLCTFFVYNSSEKLTGKNTTLLCVEWDVKLIRYSVMLPHNFLLLLDLQHRFVCFFFL